MRVTPVTLVVAVLSVGLAGLTGLLWLGERVSLPYGHVLLAGFIAVWLLFTVLVCVPTAAIAQAARNKRYGVFSHLRQATTKQVQGGTNVADEG